MSGWSKDQRHCTWCAFAVLVGFLVLALYLSPMPPTQSPNNSGNATAKSTTENEKRPIPFWQPSAWDATAAFTLLLAVGTFALAYVSWKAANAAETSTRLARDDIQGSIAAERARFYPIISHQNLGNLIDSAERFARTSPTAIERAEAVVQYRLKNYGKSAAIFRQNSHCLFMSAAPPSPVYTVSTQIPEQHMIAAGDATDAQTVFARLPIEKLIEWIPILDGTSFIWFAGQIEYFDIFGQVRTDRFLFRYVRSGSHFRFQPYDYKHYNQSS